MGNATMILDSSYFRLRDDLGLAPIMPMREGSTANYYDERILDYFDIDFRRIFLPSNKSCNRLDLHDDGTFTDVWGIRYRKDGLYVTALNNPLAAASTVKDVADFNWPDGRSLFLASGMREKAKRLYDGTDYALVARNPFSPGFIDRASQLMGTENFLVGMYTVPDIVNKVLENILKVYLAVYEDFLGEVGPYVQMVETADDIGTQSSLLLSPEQYRQFIKPLEKKFYARINELAPEAYLFRHTDGAIQSVMEDLIEVGVDIINPVQTSATGMDPYSLKSVFGDRICFHGAIEKIDGTTFEIESEVERIMLAFKPGGGYVFAPCNHIIDAEPASIKALFAAADRCGAYAE